MFRRIVFFTGFLLVFASVMNYVQAQQLLPLPRQGTVEFIKNSGFEILLTSDIPHYWDVSGIHFDQSDKVQCSDLAHTGFCTFLFGGNPDGSNSSLSQKIVGLDHILDGSTLTFSAFVDPLNVPVSTTIGSVKVKLSNGSTIKLKLTIQSTPPDNSNTYIELSDTTTLNLGGATITSVTVKVFNNQKTNDFLIDDVSLRVTDESISAPMHQIIRDSGDAGDNFGRSVAIDGNTMVIGAPGAEFFDGAVFIYAFNGTTWILQQKLTATASNIDTDEFGTSIAINDDTLVVGAPTAISMEGVVYIYTRQDNSWVLQQQLTTNKIDSAFGRSVAIDGSTLVVGAFMDHVGTSALRSGAAYIYTRQDNSWSLQQQLVASDAAANDRFGMSVSISGDTVVVGAPHDEIGVNIKQGSAYIYTRNGSIWTEQKKLFIADGALGDKFGRSVSIDGDTIVIGNSGNDIGPNINQGSAYVYKWNGSKWKKQQILTANDGSRRDWFGSSVAISGNMIVVGAFRDYIGANEKQGSAYIYLRNNDQWTQQHHIVASDGSSLDEFGVGVALSEETVVIGAPGKELGIVQDYGTAYVFDLPEF